MNWYHRGEERYVEYGTSFKASQAFGFKQSLTDTIYNMNLEHLSSETPTVFERLDDAGVRTAGTTYLMYRGRHRHEVANETALTRLASTVFRHAGLRARRSSSTPTCSPRGARAAAPSSACRACATSTPAASARTWSSTTCSTSCCSRCPTTTRTRTRTGRSRRSPRWPQADRQIERLMHAAGGAGRVPRGARGDRLLGPLAVPGGGGDRPVPGVRRLRRAAGLDGARAARRRARSRSARPRARRRSTCSTPTARRELVPRAERTLLELDGVDLVMRMTDHPDGEAVVRGKRGGEVRELRFAPARRPRRTCAASAGASRATSTCSACRCARAASTRRSTPTRSAASGRRCAAATAGELLASAAPRLRVPRLGRRPPRRRRLARLAARQRLARLAAVVRHRAAGRPPRAVVAARRRADGRRALRRRAG